MKKLVLWLVISLGLVSVVNANGACEEEKSWKKIKALGSIARSLVSEYDKQRELSKTLHNLILSHHIKEFKIDDKESICAYMNVFDMSFENVKLSQDEITKFERYMAENGEYDSYEKYKDEYLLILKFFTYYRNQIPSIYDVEAKSLVDVWRGLNDLKSNNGEITLYRYVYGKKQGQYMFESSFNSFKKDVEYKSNKKCSEATANSKEELAECQKNKKILPPILKWAQSNMKQQAKDSQ